jgi:hypothetical protein
MLKTNLIRAFVVGLIIAITYTDSFADIRVQFARGRTSATMSGSLRGSGGVCYVARAGNGQTMNATVSSRNGRVSFRSSGETSFSEYLDYTGDHRLCIDNNGGAATGYTITISIR